MTASVSDDLTTPDATLADGARSRWRRLKTGTLLFIGLSLALAPIGAIGIRSGIQSMLRIDADSRTLLQGSVAGQAATLNTRLSLDRARVVAALLPYMERLRRPAGPAVLRAVEDVPDAEALAIDAACRAVVGAFPGRNDQPSAHLINSRTGANLCVAAVPVERGAIGQPDGTARIDPATERLIVNAQNFVGGAHVEIRYAHSLIKRLLAGDDAVPRSDRRLFTNVASLPLDPAPRTRVNTVALNESANVGTLGVGVTGRLDRAIFANSDAGIGLLVPIGMWLAAALLSWLIVDAVLLTPVMRLRQRLAAYRPGDVLPMRRQRFAVREVDALESMTGALAERVSADKAQVARSLEHQRALTREVHHRVKNNLQIIASLINLHSRAASDPAAIASYGIMQRRVEALAVVHRHLQAQGESGPGVPVGALVSDIVAGLRDSDHTRAGDFTIDINGGNGFVSQDTALPMAFFIIELCDLALIGEHAAPVHVELKVDAANHVMLRLSSAAFRTIGADTHAGGIAARVLDGLARQLRQPLQRDDFSEHFGLCIPLNGADRGAPDARDARAARDGQPPA